MKHRMWGLVSAAVIAAGAAPQNDGLELGLAAVRQYRATGGQTLVDGFVRVPFLLLEPVRTVSGGFAVYRVAVVVRDTSGLQLFAQSWSQRVQARLLATRRGSTLESFSFAATPGGYWIAVTVTDWASGRVARAELGVEAFAAEATGNNTKATLNFRPTMSREFLINGYRDLMKRLYEPRHYYQRIRTFLAPQKPCGPRLRLSWSDLKGFVKSLWLLGFWHEGRLGYWRLFVTTLLRRPRQFTKAMELAITGYHFRRVARNL